MSNTKDLHLLDTFFCCLAILTMSGLRGKEVSFTLMLAGLLASSSAFRHRAAWSSKPSSALQMAGAFLQVSRSGPGVEFLIGNRTLTLRLALLCGRQAGAFLQVAPEIRHWACAMHLLCFALLYSQQMKSWLTG